VVVLYLAAAKIHKIAKNPDPRNKLWGKLLPTCGKLGSNLWKMCGIFGEKNGSYEEL
jgi:hypothetical protein